MPAKRASVDWQLVLGPLYDQLSQEELAELEVAVAKRPRRAIRLADSAEINRLPFEVEPVPWYSHGYYLASSAVRPGGLLEYAAGDYYIQDAGSMLALALCEISAGEHVCDTCASPGGKSTAALEQLKGAGLLVSNEAIGSRLAILGLALARSGFGNYALMNQDIEVLAEHLPAEFDCVMVDAPCSGQSMVVRGKQSMAAYSAKQVQHSSARQLRIIRAAAKLVKPGGRLVYSTCTFSFDENEAIVRHLLDERPTWSMRRYPDLSAWETPGFPGCYRIWPQRDGCAGAFAAAVVRPSSDLEAVVSDATAARSLARTAWSPLPACPAEIEWLDDSLLDNSSWYQRGAQLHRFDAACHGTIAELAAGGIPMAEQQANRFDPLYGSSVLTVEGLAAKRIFELNDAEARSFVAGESIRTRSNFPEGWGVASWDGRRLAWAKMAAGVLKNHFPKPLRQRTVTYEQ